MKILWNHDRTKPIGKLRMDGDAICFEFNEDVRMTREMFHEIFGNVGYRVTQIERAADNSILIKSGQILEWSFPADASGCNVGAG